MKGHFQVRAPYERLIAATDGSELGGMALVGAAQLDRRTQAELYVSTRWGIWRERPP